MLRMALIIILTAFMGVAYAAPHQCPVLASEGLSERQIKTIHKSYEAGKVKDMSYSLAAIVWKESSAGRYMVNLQDPSAGPFMITVDNALVYLKWKDTPFNRNRAAQMLIEDFHLSAEFAMINLQFWKDQYGENWFRIWQGYNGGYSKSAASEKYAHDIARKIQKIKLCHWS